MKVPKWLKLQEQIDYNLFLLGRIEQKLKNRSGITIMIDQATGYEKEMQAEAMKIMKKLKKLKKQYDQEVS